MLRRMLSNAEKVPDHFSRPEVLKILEEYYSGLDERIDIELHRYAR
jgi:sulfate adenylyltransferase